MKKILLMAAFAVVVAAFAAFATPTAKADTAGPSSYLCWNHEMVNPVAHLDTVADALWATGRYFEPQAVLGNVAGGTNIGAYHLVCNAAIQSIQNVGSATSPVTGFDKDGQTISFHDGQWWYPSGSPAIPAVGTMTPTDLGLGGSGEVYDALAMAAYHADHPVNGNDLNVYHIWK